MDINKTDDALQLAIVSSIINYFCEIRLLLHVAVNVPATHKQLVLLIMGVIELTSKDVNRWISQINREKRWILT